MRTCLVHVHVHVHGHIHIHVYAHARPSPHARFLCSHSRKKRKHIVFVHLRFTSGIDICFDSPFLYIFAVEALLVFHLWSHLDRAKSLVADMIENLTRRDLVVHALFSLMFICFSIIVIFYFPRLLGLGFSFVISIYSWRRYRVEIGCSKSWRSIMCC